MRRVRWFAVLAFLFIPGVAQAIQLHWSSGADTLTFAEATRAILMLRADSAEVTLPPEWRLLWVGDSTEVEVVALDSLEVCEGDTAQVYGVDGPSTPDDSTAHQVTAHFCSGGSGEAEQATFLLDLPAWGRGKCKVVALDPADSTAVLESNEVTFNGGVEDDYAPVILAAASQHSTALLQVTVTGEGLQQVTSLSVGAADGLWKVPLRIDSRSRSRLDASAEVPTVLPQTIVVATGVNASTSAPLAADQITVDVPALPDTVLFRDPNWSPNWPTSVYPKDFSFFYNIVPSSNGWKGLFHLIYIRHNNNYQGEAAESLLVHAWSEDLRNWRVDKRAISPNYGEPSAWDQLHVWAPSLVAVGDSVLMFYTGVDANKDQRIGYAATALLDTTNTEWRRYPNPVYSAGNTAWAQPTGNVKGLGGRQQFRDPFVMADPQHAGRYLLFNVGEDLNYAGPDSLGYMVVGVARNTAGTFALWNDLGPYRATDYAHTGATRVESPLMMRDSSGTGPWRLFFGNGEYDSIGSNSTYVVKNATQSGVADTTVGYWTALDSLYFYLGDNPSVLGWIACEHLQIGRFHLFAGYNGDGIAITRTYWDSLGNVFRIGSPEVGVGESAPLPVGRFYVSAYRPGMRRARFVIESPVEIAPRLSVHDVAGRLVGRLLDGSRSGKSLAVDWDLRGRDGGMVPAGVYFARLSGCGAPKVLRVVVIR